MAGQSNKPSKSLSNPKYAYASELVTKVIEPKIDALVKELNVVLAQHGTMAGCEIQWFFDKLPEPEAANQGDDDDEN